MPPPSLSKAKAKKIDNWLGPLLLAARTVSTAAESFPYLKGVVSTVVILLETVETVKKNREALKELCGNVMEIITIVREQISLHGDTAALRFKGLCGDLEQCLHGVLSAIKELERQPEGLRGRFKELIRGSKTAEEILTYEKQIRELRSNFVLIATMDTNFQVHKVLTVISPVEPPPQITQGVNTCPPPSKIFHGRKKILDQMHTYFLKTGAKQRIFLLHGLGGAGKTQIGLKFIQNSALHYSDMFHIDMSTVETIKTGLKNIALKKDSQDALRWLSNESKDWLLFFDNADDPQIDLNNYFPKCNHGSILITSRNPGLCVHADAHSLVSDLEETEAVELLLKSAAQEMTPKNKEISAEIVKVGPQTVVWILAEHCL
ncbi:FabD/lysophospholipase-like protein [Mycena sanguinolenta]|uniref:FabD/lysophospholipase-like protein n=1 Tax=Mycena sanguinolenta TaxID=230812 RepID=A0A8H6ZHI1_9AGAR|nr:FabD/lysophospholipase-like protein [Mycena sanguinolenta]